MTTNFKWVQAQTFSLAGSGVSAGDNSMILTEFNQIDGTALTMSNFGIQGFGTCEPASGINEEQIAFTGIVSNIDGTVTLTGISTVLDVYPLTQTANFVQGHAGGTAFVLSNTAGFYGNFPAKGNDETITGIWLVPYPTLQNQIANKQYVDDVAIAGAPNASTIIQGLVQLATQAQYDAKTLTGSTGAKLVATPDLNRATKYNDYVVDTGSATAYVITPSPAISAYAAGQEFTFKAANTNTGSATLAVSGLSAQTIKTTRGSNLFTGQILAGQIVQVVYDGTNFQYVSNAPQSSVAFLNVTSPDNTITSTLYPVNGCDMSQSSPAYWWFATNTGTTSISIYRLEKQSSGNYIYKGVTASVSTATSNLLYGITETGGFVYLHYADNGTVKLIRHTTALATPTNITGFAATSQATLTSDPTTAGKVWLASDNSTVNSYTISGTAASLVDTITLSAGLNNKVALYKPTTTDFYVLDSISSDTTQPNLLKHYDATGTALADIAISLYTTAANVEFGMQFINLAGSLAYMIAQKATGLASWGLHVQTLDLP